MATFTDPELAFLIGGFAAIRADIDDEPDPYADQWDSVAAVEARMKETQP